MLLLHVHDVHLQAVKGQRRTVGPLIRFSFELRLTSLSAMKNPNGLLVKLISSSGAN